MLSTSSSSSVGDKSMKSSTASTTAPAPATCTEKKNEEKPQTEGDELPESGSKALSVSSLSSLEAQLKHGLHLGASASASASSDSVHTPEEADLNSNYETKEKENEAAPCPDSESGAGPEAPSPPLPVSGAPGSAKVAARAVLHASCSQLLFEGKTEAELRKWEGFKTENVKQSSGYTEARVLHQPRKFGSSNNNWRAAPKGDQGDQTMIGDKDVQPEDHEGLDKLKEEFRSIPPAEVTTDRVLALADKYGFLSAKWFFFVNSEFWLSQQWQRLCRDAVSGRLPAGVSSVALSALLEEDNPLGTRGGCKRADNKGGEPGMKKSGHKGRKISMKVRDFSDPATKSELFKYLESTKLKAKAMLKPDIFTQLGIYSDSPEYNIRPTIEFRYVNLKAPVTRPKTPLPPRDEETAAPGARKEAVPASEATQKN